MENDQPIVILRWMFNQQSSATGDCAVLAALCPNQREPKVSHFLQGMAALSKNPL
jgi:hypothetical protein